MIDRVLLNAPIFLLFFVRCFAMLMTLPLFSTSSVPRVAKIALAGYMAFFVFGSVNFDVYLPFLKDDGTFSIQYLFLVIGEGLIGVILGFYISIIFAAFSTAGQFTAFQMGFSASEVYDALSQVENPLLGQFLNLVAMLVFMQNRWFQKLFLGGLVTSFDSINAISLVSGREHFVNFVLQGLTRLFADALVIALPIMGTLLLISVCTGLLSKAAPQMNLLSEGFPIMILLAFTLIMFLIPAMCDFFVRSFNQGFSDLEKLFYLIGGHLK